MAGANLQAILGAPNLSGIIRQVEPGLASDVIPPEFMKVGRRVVGNVFEATVVEGERRMARASAFGSPSQGFEAKGMGARAFSCVHTSHNIAFNANTLLALFKPNTTEMQDAASDEVEREIIDFKQTFSNLRTASVTSVLTNQAIYFNTVGEVQASSTNAALTVSYNIPAGNTGRLNPLGDGNIISAGWNTAGTDIIAQIKKIKIAARKLTNFPIAHAFYGANVFGYLLQNTVLQAFLKHNPGWQQRFLEAATQNEIPDGFMGLTWHSMEQAFLVNAQTNPGGSMSAETVNGIFGDDQVVFTPEPNRGWYDLVEGSELVPQTIDLVGETGVNLSDYKMEYGQWAYAKSLDDPLRLLVIMGDNFLPVIRSPKCIFNANVKI